MKPNVPLLSIIVGYDCPSCGISGIRRNDKSCGKCGAIFNWAPFKAGRTLSAKRIKAMLVKTEFTSIELVDAGKARFNNKLILSVDKSSLNLFEN